MSMGSLRLKAARLTNTADKRDLFPLETWRKTVVAAGKGRCHSDLEVIDEPLIANERRRVTKVQLECASAAREPCPLLKSREIRSAPLGRVWVAITQGLNSPHELEALGELERRSSMKWPVSVDSTCSRRHVLLLVVLDAR